MEIDANSNVPGEAQAAALAMVGHLQLDSSPKHLCVAGHPINTTQECCTACQQLAGCNVWTFCPYLQGCDSGCQSYVAT